MILGQIMDVSAVFGTFHTAQGRCGQGLTLDASVEDSSTAWDSWGTDSGRLCVQVVASTSGQKSFIVVVFVNKGIYLLLKHCSEPKEDAEGQTFWWHLVTPTCIVGMQVGWPIKRI